MLIEKLKEFRKFNLIELKIGFKLLVTDYGG
jgi:hypothetical protein